MIAVLTAGKTIRDMGGNLIGIDYVGLTDAEQTKTSKFARLPASFADQFQAGVHDGQIDGTVAVENLDKRLRLEPQRRSLPARPCAALASCPDSVTDRGAVIWDGAAGYNRLPKRSCDCASELRCAAKSPGGDAERLRALAQEAPSKRSIEEIDRHRIVQHPAHPGRCLCPAIGAAILA
jgi:hypothetical protein